VLLQDPEVRNDLLASGLNLTRAQVDRRLGRDDFWGHSVERVFNNLSTLVSLAFTGHLNGVDVQAPPPVYRAGEKLKFMCFKSRGVFTSTYSKWSVSGQNYPENFVDYLPTLPRSTEISVEGKKALVLFVSMRCGIPEEDTDVLNFTKKTCPPGVGYDDLDTNESCNDQDDEPRQKKRARGATGVAQGDMMQQFGDVLMKTVQPILHAVRSSGVETAEPIVPEVVDVLLQKFEDVASKLQQIEDRRKSDASRGTDDYFRHQLEKRLNKIKAELEKDS
jgi:hypothetical protein